MKPNMTTEDRKKQYDQIVLMDQIGLNQVRHRTGIESHAAASLVLPEQVEPCARKHHGRIKENPALGGAFRVDKNINTHKAI